MNVRKYMFKARAMYRFANRLPKVIRKIYNVSTNGIYLAPSRYFACTSDRSQVSPLESIIHNLPQEDVKMMLQPYYYTASMPNNTIMPDIIRAYNYWTKLPDDVLEIVNQVTFMCYEAVLLPDDVEDDSDYRRGLPTAHKIFGISRTQIASRVCHFVIMKKLLEINEKAAQFFVDCVLQYGRGVYKCATYRDNRICPTIEEYRHISIDRSSTILSCVPLVILQILAGNKTDFTKVIELIGVYIQYLTDTSNLCDDKTWQRKGFCSDISEGNYTIAIIHAINSGTMEGNIVANITRQKTKDLPTLKYCLSLLEKLGSLDFAKKETVKLENELRKEIVRLGGNPLLVACIDKVSTWMYDELTPTDHKSLDLLNNFTP